MFDCLFRLALIGFPVVFTMMFVLWVIHLWNKNAGMVDIGWGIGFILLTAVYAFNTEGFFLRKAVIFVMVALWGIRIALFLIRRAFIEKREDDRYRTIREGFKNDPEMKFFLFFEFQAVLQVLISIPFMLICLNTQEQFGILEYAGIIVWVVALWGETIADEQLKMFKSDVRNKGKVCQVGLWNYSRHPNYFFEWLTWMGFFIFALGSPNGWMGFVAPLIMYYLVMYVSGVPLTETQSLKSRGEQYRQYQKTTSVFFPLPKKA